ncbi:MAG: peroxide stress protein YaaA [Bacteroidales bacterium]|nr:peroxide stress protein YaaA [Bacteroidales bacterium]
MLIVISPAKTLDFEQKAKTTFFSENVFFKEAQKLNNILKKFKTNELVQLMGISQKLAELNKERFATWKLPFTSENAKQALLAFKGDVYTGLDADSLSEETLQYTQKHLRILSGLYGVLRPLDLMQPYRLEMGTALKTSKFDGLYNFWGDKLTKNMNQALKDQGDDILINLASNEYFKALNKKTLKAQIITPVFKDFSNGEYKMISFFAKKARGLMSRYILENELSHPEDLKHFTSDGYAYNDLQSSTNQLVFLRG